MMAFTRASSGNHGPTAPLLLRLLTWTKKLNPRAPDAERAMCPATQAAMSDEQNVHCAMGAGMPSGAETGAE